MMMCFFQSSRLSSSHSHIYFRLIRTNHRQDNLFFGFIGLSTTRRDLIAFVPQSNITSPPPSSPPEDPRFTMASWVSC